MVMMRSLKWLVAVGIAVQALAPDAMPYVAGFASVSNASVSDNGAGVAKVNIGYGCGSTIDYKVESSNSTTPTYSYVISNPLAQFISVHFSQFNLPRNDYVVIRPLNPKDKETRTLTIHGEDKNGDFFSTALDTTQIVVEVFSSGEATPINPSNCLGFTISEYRYAARPANNAGSLEEVCGADNSQEAACLRARPDIFRSSNAVIRLLIHKSEGSFFCTGWLVGCAGHVITNNHCISETDHAANTQFEFMAQGGSCSINCQSAMGCESNNKIQGSTLITTSEDLDYTLVQLPVDPTGSYGYLQLRDSGPVLNENIYIPQHPQGWGKRIAVKTDNGYGTVESLSVDGCAPQQVAYSLDTYGGSSGSPVIATADNLVIALHHCGGCPNTAINIGKIIADMRGQGVLPPCAIYQQSTPAPPPPTPAPTPPPAPTPAPRPVSKTTVDGTIFAAATTTSVDYVDFMMQDDGAVELDILSMETSDGVNFVDVNGDCNAGHLDTGMVLFRLNGNSISTADVIATNNDAPSGYGRSDGSISSSDSYMYLPLTAGRYRLAISAAPMSTDQAVARSVSPATPRVCNARVSNYGSYRLTVATSARVIVQSPGSYIGSQCSGSATVQPYTSCSYHREAPLSAAVTADGTINRSGGSVSVDRMMFKLNKFGRVTIEVSSFETVDGSKFVDVNGDCSSAYIDPVVYVFRSSNGNLNGQLKMTDLMAVADDDDKFSVRKNRRSISFRDPYLSLPLPKGNYVLVVGRYPLNVGDAMSGSVSADSGNQFSPFSCGQSSIRGNYMVTIGASDSVNLQPPGSFSGPKCSPNVGKALCTTN